MIRLNSVGKKLLVAIALPGLVVALSGLLVTWRHTDAALREDTREDAVAFASLIATSFGAVDETPPGTPPRVAHRAVTLALRSNWSELHKVADVRILDRGGVVRWSKRIEEEDRPLPAAQRLLSERRESVTFDTSPSWPWSAKEGGGEVIYRLGGVACGSCHTGDKTLDVGTLQLTVDAPSVRREVSSVFLNAIGAVLVFALVLVGASALGLRRFLNTPLTRLVGVMQRAEGGELLVRAPPMGSDEIGRLALAFNRMLAKLTELKAVDLDRQNVLDRAQAEALLKGQFEQLNTRLGARLSELQILFDLARTISSTLDLPQVLERITTEVPRLGVPKFSIMLLNAEGALEIVKAHPTPVSTGLTFAIGDGICGTAARTLRSVYSPDLELATAFKARGGQGARGRGCLLAVPMQAGGELFGVLNFERVEKADFSADEIEFFTAVTDQAAMAVANARLHEQTVTLSITDPLTGIPNRRHLFAQLDAELHRANRFGTQLSLLMIDIDHFKHLNDTAGHSAGDDALRQVCAALKKNLRKVDTLARYGGEEFAVLLPQVARAEAFEVAEKLRRAVEEIPFEHAKTQPLGKVTVSIGVANLPGDATNEAQLVDCADSALYASKRGGRNKVSAFAAGMETHPGRERGPKQTRPG